MSICLWTFYCILLSMFVFFFRWRCVCVQEYCIGYRPLTNLYSYATSLICRQQQQQYFRIDQCWAIMYHKDSSQRKLRLQKKKKVHAFNQFVTCIILLCDSRFEHDFGLYCTEDEFLVILRRLLQQYFRFTVSRINDYVATLSRLSYEARYQCISPFSHWIIARPY